ncbi:hypothetical protein CO174_04890 [Candidatus Uhrbacteria bacterium CG_4_9_14_3_um_filter_50_9]|uniref:Dipeptidylpeptidase IV N-terminal domain-containing protein n=1 Tax=Candidatus Uhrbacteria bacterium CG_4_9_14_3_um_filter_50_9 TaxID=1975035 RepID=A0A2M7XB86_9BACT|nr:MAG: hypothetical protein CO174_04890 [Candidatus Uhrbacteria bacterium CG_4_9_14_3_um_filter_50_9]
MSQRLKRILLIIGFVLSVFAFAFILYALFFRSAPPEATVEDTEEELTGVLPSSGEGGVRGDDDTTGEGVGLTEADTVARGGVTATTTLTTSEVTDTVINGNDVNYYDPTDGRFYTINEDGEVVAMSSTQFPEVETVVWNKDSEKALLEFPDGSNIIYDFETEDQVTLPDHWEDFDFSPVTDEIIAKSIGLDPNNRWLVIASDDGSQTESIAALGQNESKVDVNWSPNDQVVAFADTVESREGGFDRRFIIPVGKNEENFKGLTVEGLDFISLWSPNGKQLLYSVAGEYSDFKPLIWLVEATSNTMGNDRHSLGLNTWADKCTWHSSSEVYCAVPTALKSSAGLQRSLSDVGPDVIYYIDVKTGRASLLAIPEDDTVISGLWVSDDGTKLYFTNDNGQLQLMYLR